MVNDWVFDILVKALASLSAKKSRKTALNTRSVTQMLCLDATWFEVVGYLKAPNITIDHGVNAGIVGVVDKLHIVGNAVAVDADTEGNFSASLVTFCDGDM